MALGLGEGHVTAVDMRLQQVLILDHAGEEIRRWRPGRFPLAAGIAIGEGRDVYRIQLFSPSGERVSAWSRELERLPKTDAEIEAERESRSAAASRLGPGPEGTPPPPEIDPLRRHFSLDALRFDDGGRLWVRTDRGTHETVFDVFSAEGSYLGEVSIDGRARSYALGAGHLAAAILDELDIGTVRVWRVEG